MASLKKAISDKCKDCTYDQCAPGTWREQVEACTVKSCALWPVRPISTASITAARKQKGNEMDMDALLAGLEDESEDENDTLEA